MQYKYTNVSNPAAYGVQWEAGTNGNAYQLVNPRGTSSLWLGIRHENGREWTNTSVVSPERFGMKGPVRSFKEFMVIVRRYVEE